MGVMGVEHRHKDESADGADAVDPVKGATPRASRSMKRVRVTGERGATGEKVHAYVAVQRRGTVALPPTLRRRYHLDEPGAQVEITEREDGVLELRPLVAVPASEAWFWDERWQAGEREVHEHVAAGEVTEHATGEDFLAHLDALDAKA
jgi:bifunctional DNA-binding transcriptional regulator/antitoxin component of YhaV-PrlF toxin-antitoxin module